MTYRWFDKLADAISVRDVMQTTTLPAGEAVDESTLLEAVGDRGAALVVEGKRTVVGLVTAGPELANRGSYGDLAEPIDTRKLITAGSSLLDAIAAFAEREPQEKSRPYDPLVVVDRDRIAGTLTYWALTESFPFRACLLILTLGLEEQSLSLLECNPEASFAMLGKKRQQMALRSLERDWGKHFDHSSPYKHLSPARRREIVSSGAPIHYTNFADKKEMISKRTDLPREWSVTRRNRVLETASKIRNRCAHPIFRDAQEHEETELLGSALPPRAMLHFIQEVTALTGVVGKRAKELGGAGKAYTGLRVVRSPSLT